MHYLSPKYLLGLFLLLSATLWSRDIYWVNDGGNFVDPAHWSLSSGGPTSNIIPGEGDQLFFDENSFSDDNQIISLNSAVKVSSIQALYSKFRFNGSINAELFVVDIIKFSSDVTGNVKGKLTIPSGNRMDLHSFGGVEFGSVKSISYDSSDRLLGGGLGQDQLLAVTTVTITIDQAVSCFNDSDGTLTASHDGVGPFTYSWTVSGTPGVIGTSATLSNVPAGSYTCVVTDLSDGIPAAGLQVLGNPFQIQPNLGPLGVIDVSCNGGSDGSINYLFTSGGQSPYTYTWDDPGAQTSLAATGLSAGTYNLLIEDDNGCTETYSETVGEPSALVVGSFSDVDVDCNGNSTGTATVAASGGTGTITYTWNDPGAQSGTGASHTATGLAAGTYTATITDDNACSLTQDVTVDEPTALVVTANGTDILCNGDANGQVILNVTGGATPYASYSWDLDPRTVPNINNLGPNTYVGTVEDANGCTANDSYTVVEPAILSATTSKNDLQCFEVCNGDATVVPSGGTAPYTYEWTDPGSQTDPTATGLCAGAVTVEVTDNNGCTFTPAGETLIEPTEILPVVDAQTNPTCFSGCDGDITVSATGGTEAGTYDFLWDDPGAQTTANPTGLCDGTYTVTVTDDNGCTNTVQAILTQPDSIIPVLTATPPVCYDSLNGQIASVTTGGDGGPYTYLWDDGGAQTTPTATGLGDGTYTVVAEDGNGCQGTATATLVQPDEIVVALSKVDVTCKSFDNGSISTAVTGGAGGPYPSYVWNDPSASTTTGISSLAPGNYSVTVTDINGCIGTNDTTITEPDTLSYTFDAITNPSCNGNADGDISGTTAGGTLPYTYLWTNGAGPVEDPTNLSANTYEVRVTDFNGCVISGIDTSLTEAAAIVITEDSLTQVTCNGDSDGAVYISVTGGVVAGDYDYSWNDLGATITQDLTGVPVSAPTYTVTVTDDNGCFTTSDHAVTEPDAITGSVITVAASCNGQCNGEVLVTPAGGAGPGSYSYSWDDPDSSTGVSVDSLCAATYTVTITDTLGCIGNAVGVVTEPAAGSVDLIPTPGSCAGACDGQVVAIPSGGVAPYASYTWDDPGVQTDSIATGLCVGPVEVVVVDAVGCVLRADTVVTAPVTVTAAIFNPSNATCFGESDGAAEVRGTGGFGTYTYEWSPIALTDSNHTTLPAGTHSGIIIDGNGCRDTATVVITEPDEIIISTDFEDPLCFGGTDGLAYVTGSIGGDGGPYTYTWNDPMGTANDSLAGVAAGAYTVTSTDGVGCKGTALVTLTDPTELTTITSSSNTCFSGCTGTGIVTPVGGSAPYTYTWDFDPLQTDSIINNLCDPGGLSTAYDGTVFDANGCPLPFQVTISSDPEILTSITSNNVQCAGDCDGDATLTVSGGFTGGPFDVVWDDPMSQTSLAITGLCDTTYVATITERTRGCIVTDTIIITQPDSVIFSAIVTDVSCFGLTDGAVDMDPSGGGGGIVSTSWSNGTITEDLSNVAAASYVFTVRDANNCNFDTTVVVNQPPEILATITTDTLDCFGDSNGQLTVNPTGGAGAPFTQTWDDPLVTTTPTVGGLIAGVYNVTVLDSDGCPQLFTDSVVQPDSLQAGLVIENITCFGETDGITYSVPTGGTSPYTFLWDDIAATTNDSLTGLSAGAYAIEVRDDNNCLVQDTATIIEPLLLTASITDTIHVVCICSGQAEVTPVGGTAPYTYAWNDPSFQTSARATNLCAGAYSVTVTDSTGCTVVVPVTITNLSDLAVSITSITDESCGGACDGEMIGTPVGGDAPYTYLWNDGLAQTDSTATALCAGEYTIQVTDVNGCSAIATDTVDTPITITAVFTDTEPTCYGDSDGEIIVTPSGGDAPYTYSWIGSPSTDSTASGLVAGNYDVTVTDNQGCIQLFPYTLGEPDSLAANADSVGISCFANCDGIALSAPTGGTSPYSWLWDDALFSTNDSIIGSCADTLSVQVTDANGCLSLRDTTIIVEPALLTSSITDTIHVNCSCTGEAEVTPVGGTAPYTYLWDDITAQTGARATALCAGTYNVTVTDFNGCTSISTVIIADQSGFDATVTDTTHNVCFGDCLGEAIATPTGGTLPYSYTWTGSASTDSTASALCAGSYFVTVSDDNGCTRNLPFTITEPANLAVSFVELTSLDCNGDCTGEIRADVTGGTALVDYTYLWDDPAVQTTNIANGLCAGNYQVLVTDDNGCNNIFSTTLNQPALLTALIAEFSNITCNGDDDGQIIASGGGGTAPYTYDWSPSFASTNDIISNLTPGSYTVLVEDANGCQDDTTQVIIEPLLLTSSITDTTHNDCFGDCNGIAIVTPVGGTSPYTYTWSDPTQTDSTAINLCAGLVTVTVTDANACISNSNVTITEPSDITLALNTSTNSTCGACNGTADISASGGSGTLTYLWEANGVGFQSTTTSATDLCATTYTVVITDSLACQDSLDVVITGPNALSVTVNAITDATCFGLDNGLIDMNATGGTGVLTYSWDDPLLQNMEDADSLAPGTYTLTVTDEDGCSAFESASITEPDTLVATIASTTPSQCNLPGTGTADVGAVGGTSPYTYLWTPSAQTDSNATALIASNYTALVTDANGCTDTAVAFVTGPNALSVQLDSISHTLCVGSADGVLIVSASGGAAADASYDYQWDDPLAQADSIATGLTAGTYTCTVTDDNGCQVQYVAIITDPSPIDISLVGTTNSSCLGCDGTAEVVATGGTGTLDYLWEENNLGIQQTTPTASDLCTSDHWVYITDANSCRDSLEIFVPGPADYIINLDSIGDISCFGSCDGILYTSVSGGSAPYASIFWDDPALQTDSTAVGLCDGEYTVTVVDAVGCIATNTLMINEPDRLIALVTDSTPSGCTVPGIGTATATVTGGTTPYDYLWSDLFGQTTPVATGLLTGNYTVDVTDANGCTDSDEVNILGPNALTVSLVSANNISCFGEMDGSIEIIASGGLATDPSDYTYSWDLIPSTSPSITGLAAGTYTCTVTETVSGCTVIYTRDIIEPTQLTGSFTDTTMVLCFGQSTGIIGFTPTGGTTPYSYSWNSGQTDSLIGSLPVGTYNLTYSDASGCNETVSMNITEPASALTSTITSVTQISCSANCEGDATVSASGGTAPYTYLWDANDNGYQQTTTFADTLCAQPYDVLVTDDNGCTSVSTAAVNSADALAISMSQVNINCFGNANGQAEVTITGGNPLPGGGYNVSWTDDPTTDVLRTGLTPGTYTVRVEDAGGCRLEESVTITEPDQLQVSIINVQQPLCPNSNEGSAEADVTGGTRPYSYTWDGGNSDSVATDLFVNDYFVVVTDANGCSDNALASILSPPPIQILSATINEPTCFGESDGSISVIALGGTGVLNWSWSQSPMNSQNPTGLNAGEHTFVLTDAQGCTATRTYVMDQPDEVLPTIIDTTHILCRTVCNGEAIVSATGGDTGNPYTVIWDSGDLGSVRGDLCEGTYGFTVSDSRGCSAVGSVNINAEQALSATVTQNNVSCFGECDASMIVNATGGSGAGTYQYSWDSGETTADVTNLCPTTKLVSVTDANNCNIAVSGQVSEPTTINATITESTNITCNGDCDGTATVIPSGGTPPYVYTWEENNLNIIQRNYRATNFCAGEITVSVTDANGCPAVLASTIITEPSEVVYSLTSNDASCNNVNDGSANLTITGGTVGVGGYTINWSGPDGFQSSNEDLTELQNGSYDVTAMDDNGCEIEQTVQIAAINTVNAYAGETQYVCLGDSVVLTGSGGNNISWSTGITADSIYVSPTTETEYILTVSSDQCIDSDTVVVGVNPQPTANAGDDQTIVNGGSAVLEALGGTSNSTYIWSPAESLDNPEISNPTASPEETTDYTVIIEDALGCSDTATVQVLVVPSIIIPSGLTPNVDGRNDSWKIEYLDQFPNTVVEIYNRWGQLVYRSEGYLHEWDGTQNGKELPVGTYYYIIDLGEGIEPMTGPVTLMR